MTKISGGPDHSFPVIRNDGRYAPLVGGVAYVSAPVLTFDDVRRQNVA